jgi:acyl carrier protein
MNRDSLRQEVLASLVQAVPDVDASRLDPVTSFRDQWDVDSLDFLTFILDLEKRLDLHVPEEDYPKLSSLNGCLEYFEGRLQGG